MLDRFIADRLPQQQGQGRPKREAIQLSRYALQSELIELHDHLKESFEHNFQFTGLSTLAPFLQNAYGRLVYSIHTINGAGQPLLESISESFERVRGPAESQGSGVRDAIRGHQVSRFIAVREYEENPAPAWARPEKAMAESLF